MHEELSAVLKCHSKLSSFEHLQLDPISAFTCDHAIFEREKNQNIENPNNLCQYLVLTPPLYTGIYFNSLFCFSNRYGSLDKKNFYRSNYKINSFRQ